MNVSRSRPSHCGGWYSTTSTSPSSTVADALGSTGALEPPRKSKAMGGAGGGESGSGTDPPSGSA